MSRLSFSSPRWSLNEVSPMTTPSLAAHSPFSAKHQSNIAGESPSCSFCLTRSEPPTTPIAIFSRSAARKATVSGETTFRGSVSVPSTSKSASTRAFFGIFETARANLGTWLSVAAPRSRGARRDGGC